MLATRETDAPFILRCRTRALSRMTGRVYVPRLFQLTRGCQGTARLPFVGVAIGVCLDSLAAGVDNKRYVRLCAAAEARLGTAMAGSIVLPIGLFLFAWTTYPSVHWIVPIVDAMLFACGFVTVFISLMSYLVGSGIAQFGPCFVILCNHAHAHLCTDVGHAASILVANSVLRSLFGTAFLLFSPRMYENLENQVSSITAFLVLGCLPFPFLFQKYGLQIRANYKYASEAAMALGIMRRRHVVVIRRAPNAPEKAEYVV